MPATRRLIFFYLLLLSLIFLRPVTAAALTVDQIRFGLHEDKIRMVIELDAASDFRVFALSDPYRIVVDLPEFKWNAGTVDRPAGTHVAAVRQGRLEPGISRIVFDMDGPPATRNAFLLPKSQGRPDRLVVDYQIVAPQLFAASAGSIFGGLTAGTAKNLAAASAAPSITPAAISVSPSMIAPPRKPGGKSLVKKTLIVLDPGHGGNDPGAVGKGKIYEKNVVLALAKELKKQLEETGRYNVLLTRESDHYIRLRERVEFARHHQADLFVSLHADSIDDSRVRGASVYTLSETASDKQTAALAAKENRSDIIAGVDLSVEDEDVANILVDLAMRDTMNQSKFFANKLIDHMGGNGVRVLENPHRYAGFAVLKAPDIPSILIEAGFMSNAQEAGQLADPAHRRQIAAAIKRGIEAYFEHVRRNERS